MIGRTIAGLFRSRGTQPTRTRNRARLTCESLEDRAVPAVITFGVDTANDTNFDHISTGKGTDVPPAGTPVDAGGLASLRAIIQYANANPQNGNWDANHYTVDLSQVTGQTIVLTAGTTLVLDTNFNFLANTTGVTIQPNANGAFNQFDVSANTEGHFTALTLTNGNSAAAGGAIYDQGTVQVQGCTFTDNKSGRDGGAIAVLSGATALIAYSTFTGNSAGDNGGAIAAQAGSLATSISNCMFNKNSAAVNGGAISSVQAQSLVISMGQITNNKATGLGQFEGYGGGVYVQTTGSTTINNTGISYNTASVDGGGLNVQNASLTMSGGSLANNTADNNGGGLLVNSPQKTVTLTSVSVTQNTATNGWGGGGYVVDGTLAGSLTALTGNSDKKGSPGIGLGADGRATITVPPGQQKVG